MGPKDKPRDFSKKATSPEAVKGKFSRTEKKEAARKPGQRRPVPQKTQKAAEPKAEERLQKGRFSRTEGKEAARKPRPRRQIPQKTQKAAEPKAEERLQKIIATAGVTSRRKAEEMITHGRVKVNGKVVTELGAKANPSQDRIEVDGRSISVKGPLVYILLNKPKGYISSVTDPLKRPVVTDLVRVRARVFPVGRLDYDAEGVILLTNDGELTNKLIHPKFSVPKKYLVKVKDVPTPAEIERLEKGVYLEDGKTLPAKARLIRETKENSWLELIITEGRNRLVKRMCLAIGHPVQKLKRVEFAGLKLATMKTGEYRFLSPKEVERLKEL
ncbi:MAG: pseudouridine synthase [Deltaproteobacteria bacterium]|nr:pseudouridine synthase [Deltaproteobacteria bacterium]